MADPELMRAVGACMLSSEAPVNDICDKGSEILRKMNDRVPSGALGKAKSCTHILAVELACRVLNVSFNRDKLMAQTNVSSADFAQALNNCKSLLRLTFTKTSAIDVLSVQFGASLKGPALDLLREYQRLYVDRLDRARQVLIDLTAAEYQTAAYFLVAKQKKVVLDKKRLLEATEVAARLFHTVVGDIERVCLQGTAATTGGSSNGVMVGTTLQKDRVATSSTSSSGPSLVLARKHKGAVPIEKENQGARAIRAISFSTPASSVPASSNLHVQSAASAIVPPPFNLPPPVTLRRDSSSSSLSSVLSNASSTTSETPAVSGDTAIASSRDMINARQLISGVGGAATLEEAASRSLANSSVFLLKRKVAAEPQANAKLQAIALQEEQRKQVEAERLLQTERKRELDRERFNEWKKSAIKKRRAL